MWLCFATFFWYVKSYSLTNCAEILDALLFEVGTDTDVAALFLKLPMTLSHFSILILFFLQNEGYTNLHSYTLLAIVESWDESQISYNTIFVMVESVRDSAKISVDSRDLTADIATLSSNYP